MKISKKLIIVYMTLILIISVFFMPYRVETLFITASSVKDFNLYRNEHHLIIHKHIENTEEENVLKSFTIDYTRYKLYLFLITFTFVGIGVLTGKQEDNE